MSDQGHVSTDETPQDREAINVVTEENQAPPPPQDKTAAPPEGESNEGKSAEPTGKEDEGKPPPKKRRRRSAERKIAALQAQLSDAEKAGQQRDAEIAELRKEISDLKAGNAAEPPKKPRLQDFKNAEEFGKAWAEYERSQEQPPADPPAAAQPPAGQPPPPSQPNPDVEALEEKGEELYGEEFAEVLHDRTLPLSANMADYIFDSDRGPDIIMWLDENREEAKELFHMRPRALAKKLDELIPTLDDTPPPAGEQPRGDDGKFTSKQPEPPPDPPGEPVRGEPSDTSRGVTEGLSMDEYARRRRAQQNAHRTR